MKQIRKMMKTMKGGARITLLFLALFFGTAGSLNIVQAEEQTTAQAGTALKAGWKKEGKYKYYYTADGKRATGWKMIGGKVFYFRKSKTEKSPKGSMVTGFFEIGEKTFYFNRYGVLKTGWQTINGENYYFKKNGGMGTAGAMATGMQVIGGRRFLFAEDGKAAVGWTTYKNKKYFFSNSKVLGIRGRAITGWKTIGKYRYFFSTHGVMQKNRWISNKYYLDSKGHMLKSCVTPDGYVVNSKGEKVRLARGWISADGKYSYYVNGKKTTGWKIINAKKYYFDEDGIRQTGWIQVDGYTYYLKSCVMQTGWKTIKGKTYYFAMDGKMAADTVVDGVEIGSDGVALSETAAGKKKILIIAGHGMGDVGAMATYGNSVYYEYKYTRQFAKLIFQALQEKDTNLSVEMYDQSYDLYQVLAGKKEGPLPNLNEYDYILEIHFNATVETAKDLKGDGVCKGVGIYVNSAKKNVTLDKKIVKAISGVGIKIWGGSTGVMRSSGLLNAKTCQAAGVSYGLLETAFIDDKDDMKFYNKNKNAMAEAVAAAIAGYFD